MNRAGYKVCARRRSRNDKRRCGFSRQRAGSKTTARLLRTYHKPAVRDAGWLAVRIESLPVVQHAHRGWEAHPPEERDRLSKRNFYWFLKRWRDRHDLLSGAG